LRKLSNSLLSEMDEAIQALPGSTPAQKLLVRTVLEHLDRAAKDASGDPQIQIDLASAYVRLGNVQGNPYDQNIGDVQGALSSLDKALSISANLLRQQPGNAAASQALGWAQQSRSEVLFGMGRTLEAVDMMRLAAKTYEDLASRPGAKAEDFMNSATAYGGLGDELGQGGMASLSDPEAALAAYRKTLKLEERIIQVDPGFSRALRGIAVSHLKIAKIEAETDPSAALLDYRSALQGMNALPVEMKEDLPNQRVLANILGKTALALTEIGRYQEALPYLDQAKGILQPFLAADPKDTRAANDLLAILETEAQCFEDRAQGIFTGENTDRGWVAANALKSLTQARVLAEKLLQFEPDNVYLRSTLGLLLVRMSAQQQALHQTKEALDLATRGVAILRAVAKQQNAHGFDLDAVATGLTIAPTQLRDPQLAVECAVRMVEMSHHQKPDFLLTLARAYRAARQPEKARIAAAEGLALLPVETPASVPSRIRKLLTAQLVK
jgi:tetratricopeptide (TPR) repeat protein